MVMLKKLLFVKYALKVNILGCHLNIAKIRNRLLIIRSYPHRSLWTTAYNSVHLKDGPRTGRPTVIEDKNSKNIVKAEPSQTVRKIAEELNVSPTSDLNDLKRIRKVKKLDKWMLCDLNDG